MQLSKRDKILLPLLLFIFLILMVQIKQILFSDSRHRGGEGFKEGIGAAMAASKDAKSSDEALRSNNFEAVLPAKSETLTHEEAHYLQLSHQYQLARIERKVLEQRAAMAAARRDLLKAQWEAQKAKTHLKGHVPVSESVRVSKKPAYQLLYLENHNGHRGAVLQKGNEYLEVSVGSCLPTGECVQKITRNRLYLKKGGKQTRMMHL